MKYVTEREKNEDTCRYQHSDFRRAYLLHLILKNIAPLQRTTPLQVHYFPYHTNRTLSAHGRKKEEESGKYFFVISINFGKEWTI